MEACAWDRVLWDLFPFQGLGSIFVWSMAGVCVCVSGFLKYESTKGYVTWQELLVKVNLSNTHLRGDSEADVCINDIVNISDLIFFKLN